MAASIWLIVLVLYVVIKVGLKNGKKANKEEAVFYHQDTIPGRTRNPKASVDAWGRRTVSDEERKKLEEYRKRKSAASAVSTSAVSAESYRSGSAQKAAGSTAATSSTVQAVRAKAAAKAGTTIVERAKANNSKLAGDETLKEIEAAHGHSEAETKVEDGHSRNCQTLKKDPDAEPVQESLLGAVEDLMVKGYDGNLSFERDFIGEAADMLAAISLPDTTIRHS